MAFSHADALQAVAVVVSLCPCVVGEVVVGKPGHRRMSTKKFVRHGGQGAHACAVWTRLFTKSE